MDGTGQCGSSQDLNRRHGIAPPTQLEIRFAGPNDVSAIARILHDSFVEFKSLYTDPGFAATVPPPEQILVRMKEGPVWVALSKRQIIGTVAAVIKGKSVYIRGMAVLPSTRGIGAGRALLQHVEDWAASQARSHLFLSTTPFLHSAIRLYEAAGFRRAASDPRDLFGTPLFLMEKNLPESPPRIRDTST